MAKIFLDANIFIDLIEERQSMTLESLEGHELYISPLSIHILLSISKQHIPAQNMVELLQLFSLVPLDEEICKKALVGPTKDYEDNIQLLSSAHADCTMFLTRDHSLQSLTFFGKARITDTL